MINEVGARLKTLREARALSGRQLAHLLKVCQSYIVSQSYVSKMETGALHPSREYVERFSRALDLSESDRVGLEALLNFYETEHHSATDTPDGLRQRQEAIARLERAAKTIRSLQTAVVPGQLQTRAYAERVFESLTGLTGETRDRAVSSRLARQKLLKLKRKRFTFLITESALRNRICSVDVMREQLERIKAMSRQSNVLVRLVPWRRRLPFAPPTGYVIHDEAVVIVDTINGFVTFRRREDVLAYVQSFDRLASVGVGGQEMFRALDRIRDDWEAEEQSDAQELRNSAALNVP